VVITVVAAAVAGLGGWFVGVPLYRPSLKSGERLGIDVSSHQGSIDWGRVRADGVSFAYLKATEGGTFDDSTFAANWRAADDAGIARGAYHFFTLCTTGILQAQHFLSVAAPDAASLPPAVDLELAGNCSARPAKADVRRELRAFTDAVESATGRPLVLYVGNDFQTAYGVDIDRPRWKPRWLRRPSGAWAIWQASGKGTVDGIAGPVDLDVAAAASAG
jgi:lysozyme